METLKVLAFSATVAALLVIAAMIGYSKVPDPDGPYCHIDYHYDFTWKPVGWKVEKGFPRTDCLLREDRLTYEDGTWEWK